MTIQYRMDGALLPGDTVRAQGNDGTQNGFPEIAYLGQPGIAEVRIEDPSGTLNITGWHTFTVDEPDCTTKPRIFTGWILGRTIDRGPYRTGAGRIWVCQIIDQNAIFGFQVFRSSHDSVRPAETDVARTQSAITSSAMDSTPIHDNGRFSTSDPHGLAAGNFVAQTPAEMIGSSASQSAKNFYAYWDDSADQISLHYDAVNTGPAAGLSISNVRADWTSDSGGTCYAPFIDAQSVTDPTNVYTGVLLHWANGYLYDQNDDLIDDLSPTEFSPVTFQRDFVYQTDRISRAATAANYLQIELDRHSREDVELTCTIQVSSAHVNLIHAGDIVNARFSHIPGFTSSTPVAVKSRQVEPVPQTSDQYYLHLTLTNSGAARGAGGGSPGVFPTAGCEPQLVQSVDTNSDSGTIQTNGVLLTAPPTPGNVLIAWAVLRTSTKVLTPTGFTAVGTGWQDDPSSSPKAIRARFFYRFVQSGDSQTVAFTTDSASVISYVNISEFSGVDQFDGLTLLNSDLDQPGSSEMIFVSATVTPLADRTAVQVGGMFPSLNVTDAWDPVTVAPAHVLSTSGASGGSSAKSALAYRKGPSASGITPTIFTWTNPASGASISRGHSVLVVAFSGECGDTPADPGQPIPGEQGSTGGGTTNFTTGKPYAPGSLKVYVDGIRQPVTETDPTTGAFQLLFDPWATEYVTWDYQAAVG